MKREIDMTGGNLTLDVLLFSLPLMLSNLLQIIFNLADVAVVGQFAGPHALGSVGSTTLFVTLFTLLIIGLASGENVITAYALGAGDDRSAEETVRTSFVLSIVSGLIIMAVSEAGAAVVLRLVNTREELFAGALLYVRIYFLGLPALSVYNFGSAVYSAGGDTKKPLVYLTVSGILNVILNLFFVLVLGMDVDGVALASIIAQYLSAFLVVRALLLETSSFRLVPAKEKPDLQTVRRILQIGLPAGFQNVIFMASNLFIQSGINTFSAEVVAGCAAAFSLDTVIFDTISSFYVACTSFMGQNFGAGKKERISRSYHLCLAYSVLMSLILGLFLRAFGPVCLRLFTSDPAVIAGGMERISVLGLSIWMSAFMDCTIAASRGIGKSAVPTVIVFSGACVIRIIWVYTVFAFFKTPASLFAAFPFTWGITSAAEILYYRWSFAKLQI